jgi:hypothetical protein
MGEGNLEKVKKRYRRALLIVSIVFFIYFVWTLHSVVYYYSLPRYTYNEVLNVFWDRGRILDYKYGRPVYGPSFSDMCTGTFSVFLFPLPANKSKKVLKAGADISSGYVGTIYLPNGEILSFKSWEGPKVDKKGEAILRVGKDYFLLRLHYGPMKAIIEEWARANKCRVVGYPYKIYKQMGLFTPSFPLSGEEKGSKDPVVEKKELMEKQIEDITHVIEVEWTIGRGWELFPPLTRCTTSSIAHMEVAVANLWETLEEEWERARKEGKAEEARRLERLVNVCLGREQSTEMLRAIEGILMYSLEPFYWERIFEVAIGKKGEVEYRYLGDEKRKKNKPGSLQEFEEEVEASTAEEEEDYQDSREWQIRYSVLEAITLPKLLTAAFEALRIDVGSLPSPPFNEPLINLPPIVYPNSYQLP